MDITVVVTACGRPDLLDQTLESFFEKTRFEGPTIIVEDSGIPNVNESLQKKQSSKNIEWIHNDRNLGQIESIDKAYQKVTTKYIFHLEDDWLTQEEGLLEESVAILESNEFISAVMCRKEGDGGYYFHTGHFLKCYEPWGQYSFNPGLRKKEHYEKLFQGSFSDFVKERSGLSAEIAINNRFRNAGYSMALTSKGYVKHLGDLRHVPDKKAWRIILCMIVKNESHCIQETLENVSTFVDAYAITDTGSTDGTQDLIKKFFAKKKIPGQVFQDEFEDFGTTRTKAFRNAETIANQGDYLFVIDADDLIVKDATSKGDLDKILQEKPNHVMVTFKSNVTQQRAQIFRAFDNYVYKGVLHEQPTNDKPNNKVLSWPIVWQSRRLGSRNHDPQKYLKDALVLEKALQKEPDNERYVFYLAQSYSSAGIPDMAIKQYEKRYQMKRWPQEAQWSAYQIAKLTNSKEWAWKAHEVCPDRAESLHWYMAQCRANNLWSRELLAMGMQAAGIKKPASGLFLEEDVYDWRILDELGVIAFQTGHKDISRQACEKILREKRCPADKIARIEANLKFAS